MHLDMIFTKTRFDSKNEFEMIKEDLLKRPFLKEAGKSKNKSVLIRVEMHSKVFKEGLPTASNAFESLQCKLLKDCFPHSFHFEESWKV